MSSYNQPQIWEPGLRDSFIVACKRCDGRGYFDRETITDYRKGESTKTRDPCECCEGSGRMVCTKTYKPYRPPTA